MSPKKWDDLRIEIIIGSLLRSGVMLAGAVVLVGGVLFLARHGLETISYASFQGEPEALKSIAGIMHGAFAFSGPAVIQLGLLLLIATPIARVMFAAGGFAMEGDYLYVVITLIVLAVLLFSLLGSAG